MPLKLYEFQSKHVNKMQFCSFFRLLIISVVVVEIEAGYHVPNLLHYRSNKLLSMLGAVA
jgi:5-hydroxyisourate hydrolase-like protein (transthyretin family)